MLQAFANEDLRDVCSLFEGCSRSGMQLLRLIAMIKSRSPSLNRPQEIALKSQLQEYSKNTPFFFKGDHTDLAYFWRNDQLSKSHILENTDPKTQGAVLDTMKLYEQNGYLALNEQAYALTPVGENYVNSVDFISSVIKKDIQINDEIARGVEYELDARANKTESPKAEPPSKYSDNPRINFDDNTLATQSEIKREAIKKSADTKTVRPNAKSILPGASPPNPAKPAIPLNSAPAATIGTQGAQATAKGAEVAAQAGAKTAAGVASGGVTIAAQVGKEVLASGYRLMNQQITR